VVEQDGHCPERTGDNPRALVLSAPSAERQCSARGRVRLWEGVVPVSYDL